MRELTYATVCSGIECCSVACRGLPLRPVFFSEIEPFPCAVLKAHYPDVPNLGDMSKIQVTNQTEITNGTINIRLHERLGILAGGTPCQDVSVAGKRAGMQEGSGTRSSLAFDFVRLARELGPRFVIWENVAGAIDSKNAPDFLAFLRALGDCGYSLAWRVLDAQYVRVDGMEHAVPQRRRRVWVVGYSGADESRAAEILFEPDCVAGHTAPRRCAGQGFAYSLAGRDRVDARLVGDARCGSFDPFANGTIPGGGMTESIAQSLVNGDCPGHHNCIALDGDKLKPREDANGGGNGFGVNEEGAGYTLTGVDRHGVAYCADGGEVASTITRQISEQSGQDNRANAVVQCYENDSLKHSEVCRTLTGNHDDRVTDTGTRVVVSTQGLDGYNKTLTGDCAPTISGAACDIHHTHGVISTNSNGEDVAPTLDQTTGSVRCTGAQSDKRGGYVVTRQEGADGE